MSHRSKMKWDTEKPCESCPYRRDAKLQFWHRDHFQKLLDDDDDKMNGAIYACHATRKLPEQSICAGWVLNQKKRNLPSIQLRMSLIRREDRHEYLDQVSDGGLELYDSIEEMVEANYPELLE